jgi:hypothetical protein
MFDEFPAMIEAPAAIYIDMLTAIRAAKPHAKPSSKGLRSIVIAGTFNPERLDAMAAAQTSVHSSPAKSAEAKANSPFNIATPIIIRPFTLLQTRTLFEEFKSDLPPNTVTFDVAGEIFERTRG